MHGRDRLRAWIDRSHLTQRQVARLFGIHYTFVNQLLAGRRLPGRDVAVTIENETGIPVGAWVATAEDKTTKGGIGRGSKRKVA
jgi:transcriptional regulator with XRE-family HTH domain